MGLIAKILDSFNFNNQPSAKVEIYKNDNANVRIFNPPGIDSKPINNDVGYLQNSEDSIGGKDLLGFIDINNIPTSEKGECFIYSRDETGSIKSSIYLKSDGSIEINAPGGLKITAETEITGNLTVSDDVITGTGISLNNHGHNYTWTDPAGSGTTDPPNP